MSPDRLRCDQWHFVHLPGHPRTVRLTRFEQWTRATTRHKFRDSQLWAHSAYPRNGPWNGLRLIERPTVPGEIAQKVRVMWRAYFAFE